MARAKFTWTKFFIILAVIAAFFVGLVYEKWHDNQMLGQFKNSVEFSKIHPLNKQYKLINPLLAISLANQTQFPYQPVENAVKKITNGQNLVSVYFRDLEKGYWFGLNENEAFDAASLLKVPIMIAYLKQAEINPNLLKTKVYFEPSAVNSMEQSELAFSDIKPSQTYSVEGLLKDMIINSDNVAKNLLLDLIDNNQFELSQKSFDETYADLGISLSSNNQNISYQISPDYRLSPRTYSLFFRILYNATFLNEDASEKAMEWLSQTNFNDGLMAGVPTGITVAHKFGEYAKSENNIISSIELHDCGVIYALSDPYFLCVMTRGNNLDSLKSTIKNISAAVYNAVQNNK